MNKSILAAAAVTLLSLSACGEADEPAEKPQPEDRNEVTLKGDEAVLPDGMPKMPGIRLDRSDAYDFDNEDRRRRSTKFFVKDASSAQIVDFYSDAMKQQEYEVTTTHKDDYSNARGTNDAGWISVTSRVKPNSQAQPGEAYAVMMQDFKRP